ncbi:MAG: Trm112 family protein [Rudaea sp.]
MDKRLLDILCCPLTKAPLAPLDKAQVEAINRAIASGSVCTVAEAPVSAALQAGLITTDGKRIYRVEDDIPILLADEAIAVPAQAGFGAR